MVYKHYTIHLILLVWTLFVTRLYAFQIKSSTYEYLQGHVLDDASITETYSSSPSVQACAASCFRHRHHSYFSYDADTGYCTCASTVSLTGIAATLPVYASTTPPCGPAVGFYLHTSDTEQVCLMVNSTEKKSYQNAEQACQAFTNGRLFVADTVSKLTFLIGQNTDPIWIGLSDKDEEGVWKWANGRLMTLQELDELFHIGEPNGGNADADCAEWRSHHRRFNDNKCSSAKHFACEIGASYELPLPLN